MDDFEREIIYSFIDEALSQFSEFEDFFLRFEKNEMPEENLKAAFRVMHNIKGSSRAVGLLQVGELAHKLEFGINWLQRFYLQVDQEVRNELVAYILVLKDALQKFLTKLQENLSYNGVDELKEGEKFLESLRRFEEKTGLFLGTPGVNLIEQLGASTPSSEEAPQYTLPLDESSMSILHGESSDTSSAVDFEDLTHKKPEASSSSLKPEESLHTAAAMGSESYIRVKLSRIDELLNLIGESVIHQTQLKSQLQNLWMDKHALKIFSQLHKISKEIQSIALSLRMIPVKPLFQKIRRAVRDLSHELHKKVDLVLDGENLEVDKTLLEELENPIMHLVRNALDHGLETEEERLKKGKNPGGKLEIRFFQAGDKLSITIRDDGKGIDAEKLIQKAIQKKILDDSSKITHETALRLIFLPSFSTKEQVTEVSGRGVGCDVVKTAIDKLLGQIHIETELHAYTEFRIILPQSLAVNDYFLISVRGQTYAVPFNQVGKVIHGQELKVYENKNLESFTFWRGTEYSVFCADSFFSGTSPRESVNRWGTRKLSEVSFHSSSVVDESLVPPTGLLINDPKEPFILLVEKVIERLSLTQKNLSPELQRFEWFTGQAILGDGSPIFILDTLKLKNVMRIAMGSKLSMTRVID